jgi:hypothetical protein
MIRTPNNAWPTERPEPDCWGGDEYLFDCSDYENHCAFTFEPYPSKEEYETADRLFMAQWIACVKRGEHQGNSALQKLGQQLGLPRTPRPDRRPPKISPIHLDPFQIWEMLENGVPDGVMVAQDRVLGPYSDESIHRNLIRIATEAYAFSPTADAGLPARKRWAQDLMRPTVENRAAMRAIEHSPAMIWQVDDDGACKPMLPLAAPYCPTGPIHGVTEQLPRCQGDALVARITPVQDGSWQITGGLWVLAPPLAPLLDRLEFEHFRLSRHERRLTWEDLLRWRAELLYRLCAIHSSHMEIPNEIDSLHSN